MVSKEAIIGGLKRLMERSKGDPKPGSPEAVRAYVEKHNSALTTLGITPEVRLEGPVDRIVNR